jgi:hypothetical protein
MAGKSTKSGKSASKAPEPQKPSKSFDEFDDDSGVFEDDVEALDTNARDLTPSGRARDWRDVERLRELRELRKLMGDDLDELLDDLDVSRAQAKKKKPAAD